MNESSARGARAGAAAGSSPGAPPGPSSSPPSGPPGGVQSLGARASRAARGVRAGIRAGIARAERLAAYTRLEQIIAGVCILMPVILVAVQRDVLPSISDYVRMRNAQVFGLLLGIASMLFMVNGAIYIKTARIRNVKRHGRWYNIALGVALLGVAIFPDDVPVLKVIHYVCALAFFLGSALVIACFNDKAHRRVSVMMAVLTLASFVVTVVNARVHQPYRGFTLFWAESVSLWVIGLHYILESRGDLT